MCLRLAAAGGFSLGFRVGEIGETPTDVGARDHRYVGEVSGRDLVRRTNRGKATWSNCRLP